MIWWENPLFSETSISWTKANGVVFLKFTFAWSIDFSWGHGVGGSEMKEIVQPARCGVMGCVRELQTTIETGALNESLLLTCLKMLAELRNVFNISFDLDLGKTEQVLWRLRVFSWFGGWIKCDWPKISRNIIYCNYCDRLLNFELKDFRICQGRSLKLSLYWRIIECLRVQLWGLQRRISDIPRLNTFCSEAFGHQQSHTTCHLKAILQIQILLSSSWPSVSTWQRDLSTPNRPMTPRRSRCSRLGGLRLVNSSSKHAKRLRMSGSTPVK